MHVISTIKSLVAQNAPRMHSSMRGINGAFPPGKLSEILGSEGGRPACPPGGRPPPTPKNLRQFAHLPLARS